MAAAAAAACLGQWPAKHKKKMGTVVLTAESVTHEASELQVALVSIERWVLSKEGPPPKIPLVQLQVGGRRPRVLELCSWEDQRALSSALTEARRGAKALAAAAEEPPPVPAVPENPVELLKPYARCLGERPQLQALYNLLVPSTLSHAEFFQAYQQQVAMSHEQKDPATVRRRAAEPLRPATDAAQINEEVIAAVLDVHPNIRRVYQDVVEEAQTMTPAVFLERFRRSNYSLRCEGKAPTARPDVLFDALESPVRMAPKVPMAAAFSQWRMPGKEDFEKTALLDRLNQVSADAVDEEQPPPSAPAADPPLAPSASASATPARPTSTASSSRGAGASRPGSMLNGKEAPADFAGKKRRLSRCNVRLAVADVFARTQDVAQRCADFPMASRGLFAYEDLRAPEFAAKMRKVLRKCTEELTMATPSLDLKAPSAQLTPEYSAVKSVIVHFYSTPSAATEARGKLCKRLDKFTSIPPSLHLAVQRIRSAASVR